MCRHFDVTRIFFLHSEIWVRNWELNEAIHPAFVRKMQQQLMYPDFEPWAEFGDKMLAMSKSIIKSF
jgi:hypothetical protein